MVKCRKPCLSQKRHFRVVVNQGEISYWTRILMASWPSSHPCKQKRVQSGQKFFKDRVHPMGVTKKHLYGVQSNHSYPNSVVLEGVCNLGLSVIQKSM